MAARRPAASLIREDAEERLLVEAAQKDPAKFGDLYEIHFGRVYAFIARRMRDRDKAEDLTSEVFHKALANLKSYTWTGDPPEPSGGPEQEAIESHARLFRLVEKLPAEQRRVVFGRFVEQRSIREIAQQLGKSEGAVKQLQFRALEKLRSQMEGAHA